ncbi:caspase family protein [Methylocystis parvus]|uniref:caspase family protein n=1 Tax=Methylocystis parvus TaxID=134 RepID=UPI003C782788
MHLIRTFLAAAAVMIAFAAGAEAAERRLALVVGESAYGAKSLPTAANDAGLVAQTLQAAGFDVTGARDLEEAALKQTFRDFLDKAAEAGPDAIVFVYFSGYGVQLEGENYLLPVDVRLTRDADIPMRALRVSDYLKPLAASGAKLSVVALDAARANPFKLAGEPLAGGLALYEPGGKMLLAYNAAPGTIAPEATGDYGPYAHALAEMIRDGGAPLMDVFENTRLRVSDMTKGGQIPWNSRAVQTDFLFFQRDANAPARVADAARLAQPIKALGPEEGFSAAIRRDTLQGYQDYVATYPAAPYAKRARAILAARREALIWRRSRVVDSPNAYWTYLRRYPKGPHAWDARRRLAELRYELEPPQSFEMIAYDYPPPPPEEIVFVEQPVVYFDDPGWGFAPPPPPPVYLLPPPPPDFIVLPPPVVIAQPYVLPAPQYVPIPAWQRAPDYIAPPPDNFIYSNAHNAIVVDPRANNVVVRDPTGGVISTGALTAVGAGAAAVAVGAALPNFIAKRNAVAPAAIAPPMGAGGVGAVPGAMPAPASAAPSSAGAIGPAPGGQPPLPPASSGGFQNAQPLPAAGTARPGLTPGAGPAGGPGPAGAGPHQPQPAGLQPAGAPNGHALPTPGAGEGAPPSPVGQEARPGRPGGAAPDSLRGAQGPGGRAATPGDAHALPAPSAPGGALPVGAGPRERSLPPAHETQPLANAPRDGGMAPAGGPASMPRSGPAERNGALQPRPTPPQGLDGGASQRPHRGIERPRDTGFGGEPMGRPGSSPTREPMGAQAPGMRDSDFNRSPPRMRDSLQGASPPQGLNGGGSQRPHRAIERPRDTGFGGAPMGRPGPSQMREPMGMPMPGMREPGLDRVPPRMREAPQGMGPPRGYSREATPGGHEQMQPSHMRAGPPPGMPPQMREMAPPSMHAPQPDRGPPAGMMRQSAPPPQAAPVMTRPPPAPGPRPSPQGNDGFPHGGGHGGGPGGPPSGFGGMR